MGPAAGNNYYLRLTFNIFSNVNADTWVSKATMLPKFSICGFGLSNYQALEAAGYNGGFLQSCERYDDNANTWTGRASFPVAMANTMSFPLDRYMGIAGGGANGSGYSRLCYVYNDTANTWVSAPSVDAVAEAVGFKLTDDGGVLAGGNNSSFFLNLATRYSQGRKTWVSVSSFSIGRDGAGAISLTKDTSIIAGGGNGMTPVMIGLVDKYSNSMNTWSPRTSINVDRKYIHGLSLSTNFGLGCGGANVSSVSVNELYNDPGNIWSYRCFMLTPQHAGAGASLTTNLGLVYGGSNGSYPLGNNSRYNFGETTFLGFASLPLT